MAAAIQEDYGDWQEIKGIQLQGKATPVGQLEKARVIPLFIRKFPSLRLFWLVLIPPSGWRLRKCINWFRERFGIWTTRRVFLPGRN